MKKLFFLVWLQAFWATGFSQGLSGYPENIHIQRTNLVVRWKAPKHPWPKVVGIYHVVPTKFSPVLISSLMSLGNLTEKDRWGNINNTSGIAYFNFKSSLSVSFATGEIEYNGEMPHYNITNLAKDVPEMNQLYQLTTNFLPKLGINLSEISKQRNGKPKFNFYEPLSGYPIPNGTPEGDFLTNIERRVVSFSRDLDGGRFYYDGGHCEIDFGEHAKILRIELSWPNLKRDKLYSAATPKQIVRRIRDGKAIQRHMMTSNGAETIIDWSKVKSLTITNAEVLYYCGDSFVVREFAPQLISPTLVYPHAELSGFVDTGKSKDYVALVCPIIDETKPLKVNP